MIMDLVKSVSVSRIREMADHCSWLYEKYFSSIEVITKITLDILNQRVFPENALSYEDWNLRPNFVRIFFYNNNYIYIYIYKKQYFHLITLSIY